MRPAPATVLLSALALGAAASAAPTVWRADFAAPGPGHWEVDGLHWQARADTLVADLGLPAWAHWREPWRYATVTCEATMTVTAAAAKEWKLAGIGVWSDDRNFWHLALVEKPDREDKGHFVELSEMLDSEWLAQGRLARTAGDGMAVNWQYGVPYRLRLTLTPEGIDGWVLDAAGTELCHLGYAFSARAVRLGRPALKVSGLCAGFTAVVVTTESAGAEPLPKAPARVFPPYAVRGSGVKAATAATGFFTVEADGERWWLVDPRGERFYAVGTDHVNYWAHYCQTLGYAPYHRNCERLYGSAEKWAESATQRLREWGFNLIGAGNVEAARYRGLAHTLFAAFGSTFSGFSALVEKTTWTGFPNVFDPRWETYCEARAQELCASQRQDPWLLGYFLDNELEWYGKKHTEDGIWTETMTWPADHRGKRALLARLQAAHPSVADFNQTWGQQVGTWDAVLELRALPATNDRARAIQRGFLEAAAERYFAVAAAAIRRADPNHLIIGSRFAGDAPAWAWQACARHCDVISFNHYPRIDFERGDLSQLAGVFQGYYEKVRRPMMITEWSFPALDAGLPCRHGAGMRVDTQAQKAACYEVMQHLLFRLPFMVGSDYFMWVDEPELGISETFPEDSNYGLVNLEDKPWPELTAMAARLNPLAMALHAGTVPEIYLTALTCAPDGLEVGVSNLGAEAATAQIHLRREDVPLGTLQITLGPGQSGAIRQGLGDLGLPPGIHRITAELLAPPTAWRPRGCRGVTRQVGFLSLGDGAGARVIVINDHPESLPPVPVLLPLPVGGGTPPRSLVTSAGTTLPLLPFAEGIVAMPLPALELGGALGGSFASSPATATTPAPVQVQRVGPRGFRIDNGVLRLEHDGTSGHVIDRLLVQGVLLGSYNPLVWQQPDGDDQWVRTASLTAAEVETLPGGVLLTVTAGYAGEGPVITTVNDQGQMADPRGRPVPFEVTHCLAVMPGLPYLLSRCAAIRNLDAQRPLILKGAFHYLLSAGAKVTEGGGRRAGVGVPNYYRQSVAASWSDAETGTRYGCVPLDRRISAHFWLDPGGGQHPDARLLFDPPVAVAPGQAYRPEGCPALLIYGALETGDGPASWNQVQAGAEGLPRLRVITPGPTSPARP